MFKFKKILRIISLMAVLSTAMPPLHGMQRLKKGWNRFAATLKGGFGRFGFKTNPWAKNFQSSSFFNAFGNANRLNRLSGLTAAAAFFSPLAPHEKELLGQASQPQPARIEFTPANIDMYLHMKKSFIEYAKKNITTKNMAIIKGIIHLVQKYPDAAMQLYPYVLSNCADVHVSLQKAVGMQCAVPTPKKAESTIANEDAQESWVTMDNVLQYGVMPILDIDMAHARDKKGKRVELWNVTQKNVDQLTLVDGKFQLKPIEKWPKAIASGIATEWIYGYASKKVTDFTGDEWCKCPEFKNDNSWNVGNRACRFTKWVAAESLAKPLIRSYIVEPIIGE